MKHNVFISYRRNTGSTMARMIYDRLRLEKHYGLFLDVEKLNAGNFRLNIEKEMAKCDIFLLVLSRDALTRCEDPFDNVRQEIFCASRLGLVIIPVTTEDFDWPERMPTGLEKLRDYNAIPYVQVYSDSFFERLYNFIEYSGGSSYREPSLTSSSQKEEGRGNSSLEVLPGPGEGPARKKGGQSSHRGLIVGLLLAGFAAGIAGGILFFHRRPPKPPMQEETQAVLTEAQEEITSLVQAEETEEGTTEAVAIVETQAETTTEGKTEATTQEWVEVVSEEEVETASHSLEEEAGLSEEEGIQEEGDDLTEAYDLLRGTGGKEADEEKAFQAFLVYANQGNGEAMNMVGTMYKHGSGVKKDYGDAIFWYRQAALSGNAQGMENLGQMYEEGKGVEKDTSEAFAWYEKAAELGDGYAQTAVGHFYEKGIAVKKDYEKAFYWYEKAAEHDGPSGSEGKNELGEMYKEGFTVPIDYDKAYALFEASDVKYARVNLARMIGRGWGVERDLAKAEEILTDIGSGSAFTDLGNIYRDAGEVETARTWYEKAMEKGNERACNNLADMYRDGLFGEPDYAKAIELYETAMEEDYGPCYNNLALFYRDGLGVPQDYKTAVSLFRKAMALGSAKAYDNLGCMYRDGLGVNVDFAEAKRLMEKAAESYVAEALTHLGDLYRFGMGVEADPSMALSYYEKAANQDFGPALYGMGQVYELDFSEEEKAMECYQKAATLGDEEAILELSLYGDTQEEAGE